MVAKLSSNIHTKGLCKLCRYSVAKSIFVSHSKLHRTRQNTCICVPLQSGDVVPIKFSIRWNLFVSDDVLFDFSDIKFSPQKDSSPTTTSKSNTEEREEIHSVRSSPRPSRKRTHSQTILDHKPWHVSTPQPLFIAQWRIPNFSVVLHS